MSPGIWMRCGGSSNLRTLESKPWRVVESQQRISTRQLVDSDAEHLLLEELIEESKPRVPEDATDLDFLLFSPFRYPPLSHGSRFGASDERSLWYGSEQIATALAEMAYYRLVFFEGTEADLLPNQIRMSAFRVGVQSKMAVDLTLPPFDAHREAITSRTDYAEPQRLGSEMRADGVELIRFPSARNPKQGINVAIFTPRAFALKAPVDSPTSWTCTVTARRDVSWIREGAGGQERYEFPRATFLVDGKLPAPAP
jgi:hypothetical protein